MQKSQFKIQLDDDVKNRLSAIGDRYGMSASAVVAAAAYELSRVHPQNLFHALGRIAIGEEPLQVEAGTKKAIKAPGEHRRAISA